MTSTKSKTSKTAAAKAIAKRSFADLSKAAKKAWATRRAMAKGKGKKAPQAAKTARPTPTITEQPKAA